MKRVTLTLGSEKKRWAQAAHLVLAYACAISEVFSPAAANWLSNKGTSLIAKYGYRIVTR